MLKFLARRRRSSRSKNSRSGRVVSTPYARARHNPATPRALPRDLKKSRTRSQVPAVFDDEPVSLPTDLRVFNPEKRFSRPPLRFSGRPARVVVATPKIQPQPLSGRPNLQGLGLLPGLRFFMPSRVAVCVQRNIRKEVLHSKKIAGKNGLKAPRRSANSSISCEG